MVHRVAVSLLVAVTRAGWPVAALGCSGPAGAAHYYQSPGAACYHHLSPIVRRLGGRSQPAGARSHPACAQGSMRECSLQRLPNHRTKPIQPQLGGPLQRNRLTLKTRNQITQRYSKAPGVPIQPVGQDWASSVALGLMQDPTLMLKPYAPSCLVHTISYLIPSRSLKNRA